MDPCESANLTHLPILSDERVPVPTPSVCICQSQPSAPAIPLPITLRRVLTGKVLLEVLIMTGTRPSTQLCNGLIYIL